MVILWAALNSQRSDRISTPGLRRSSYGGNFPFQTNTRGKLDTPRRVTPTLELIPLRIGVRLFTNEHLTRNERGNNRSLCVSKCRLYSSLGNTGQI